jgi:hypothetical protein
VGSHAERRWQEGSRRILPLPALVALGSSLRLRYQTDMFGSKPWISVIALWMLACGGPVGKAPSTAADERCRQSDSTAGSRPVALPRYFTLHVSGKEATIAGEKLAASEVNARLRQAGTDPLNQGAALLIGPGTDAETASAWFDRLLAAGFSHVVVSAEGLVIEDKPLGAEPATASVVAPASEATRSANQEPVVATPEPTAPPSPSTASPKVEVKQMGLHIGGGPNNEVEAARYAGPIAQRFADFGACYPLAKGTRKAVSFGVDLLVTSRGGRAKIKDFRTLLTGKDFLACMLDVFGTIEFSGPARDTVVSYSLLFKPQGP